MNIPSVVSMIIIVVVLTPADILRPCGWLVGWSVCCLGVRCVVRCAVCVWETATSELQAET